MLACDNGDADMTRLLLGRGASPALQNNAGCGAAMGASHARCRRPCASSCRSSPACCPDALLRAPLLTPPRHPACRARSWSALHLAVDGGHAPLVELLAAPAAAAGALDLADVEACTPLMLAADMGAPGQCGAPWRLLGADSRGGLWKAPQAATALHRRSPPPRPRAPATGRLDLVQRLLEAGAGPNHRSTGGLTALMLAAEGGHAEVVATLAAAGAALDERDADDDTALSLAIAHSHASAAKALVAAGASLARLSAEQLRSLVRLLGRAAPEEGQGGGGSA